MAMMAPPQSSSRGAGGGSGPAPFLTKTHQMVEDGGTDEVISWGEMGRSFVVWKPVEFARDLLPSNFKHNNFSSFVRQLNTYGFRKVVPDRWEFSHDNFRKGDQRLLRDIRRRKAATPHGQPTSTAKKSSGGGDKPPPSSTSNSGEILSSSSTSSPPPPPPPLPPPSQQLLDLSNENEKLKKDNQVLTTELAQAKLQYEQLHGLLSKYVDLGDLNSSLAMQEAPAIGATESGSKQAKEEEEANTEEELEAEEEERENYKGLKLFGVLLKGFEGEGNNRRKKRGYCEVDGGGGGSMPMKMGFAAPWMRRPPPAGGGHGSSSSKACN